MIVIVGIFRLVKKKTSRKKIKIPNAILRALQSHYIQVQSQPWKYYKQFSVNKVTFVLSKKFSLD